MQNNWKIEYKSTEPLVGLYWWDVTNGEKTFSCDKEEDAEYLLSILNPWVAVEDRLPEEGKYVVGIHNRGTWIDSTDQAGVNYVIVKLVKGISMEEREIMKSGEIQSSIEHHVHFDGSVDKPIFTSSERWKVYKGEDEHGNNLVPYSWKPFGNGSFFGQEITHWMPLPDKPELTTDKK